MNKFTVTTGNKDTAELNRLTRMIALHDMWNRHSITIQLAVCSKSTRA